MALFIKFLTDREPVVWRRGEDMPPFDIQDVFMIQADGDELNYLYTQFHNLPIVLQRRSVAWVGELARFIVMNIR